MNFNLDQYKLDSPYNYERDIDEPETCTCQYCDHQYLISECERVPSGKFSYYVCGGCLINETE